MWRVSLNSIGPTDNDVPQVPGFQEPEPDDPEPDDETQELVRPVKT